jgi:hypothetical protein
VLVKGGYLIRSASTSSGTLTLSGDLNATDTTFEIVAPSQSTKKVTFNGQALAFKSTKYGSLIASKKTTLPEVELPDLQSLTWVHTSSSVYTHCLIYYYTTEICGFSARNCVVLLGQGLASG